MNRPRGRGDQAGAVRGEIVDFGACCVRVTGSLDASALHDLKDELRRMTRLGCSQLIVDLTGTTSVDPAAVALLELANAVRLRRTMVAVVCPPGDLAAALEEHNLTVVRTVDEAHERFALAVDA